MAVIVGKLFTLVNKRSGRLDLGTDVIGGILASSATNRHVMIRIHIKPYSYGWRLKKEVMYTDVKTFQSLVTIIQFLN
jgi:hypothetical protein